MYSMTFVKRRTSSRVANNNSRRTPPLILGFRPSKRHAALIASCDQGSIVLAFTLALHHVISARSCFNLILILVVWNQSCRDDTLLPFNLVDLICYGLFLYLRIVVIFARLGLANGLDDPVTYQMLCLSLNRELIRESALACSQASVLVKVQLFITLIRANYVQDVPIQQ